jgi:epoxyqueuosine reductase
MTSKLSEVWPDIERVARAGGALHVGASGLDDEHSATFAEWLARGNHGSMKYLAKNAAVRSHPRERFPWAQSAVVILVPYEAERPDAPAGAMSHHVARYALGDDYHQVLDQILREVEKVVPGKSWRYVDTGPLSDRAMAAQAGLGWIGRNSMLINERDGSYFFIGTLITSLENDISTTAPSDRCGTCTRCVDACPTDAILPDRTVASQLCISYATIEHRGDLPHDVAHRLEGNAFGCDICQEVCPWNREPAQSHPSFRARDEYRATPVSDLLRFEQSDFSRLFTRSAIKRAKLAGMKRNVEALMGAEPRRPSALDLEGATHDRRID